jgi:hypothetical protein
LTTQTIRIKRRNVGAIGPPPNLAASELAFNEADNTLYYGAGNNAGQATSILAIGGVGSSQITIADTAPANPRSGNLWWDSVNALLYLWYDDGNSQQWVNVNNTGGIVGIPDAPSDARWYARRNVGWTPVPLTDVGRNKIHNGLFWIQHRGTGPWTVVNTYTADRWKIYLSSDTLSVSIVALSDADRSAIGDEEAQYALQSTFTGTSTSAACSVVFQPIEGLRRLSGKTLTLSFWAKATVGLPKIGLGCNQSMGSGGTPSANVPTNIGVTAPLTTTWTRYSFTFTMPSTAGKVLGTNNNDCTNIEFWLSASLTGNDVRPGGIGPQSGTVQMWGVQLEVGSVATPLEKFDAQMELGRCQRFYQWGNVANYGYVGSAGAWLLNWAPFPTGMRATPAIAFQNVNVTNGGALSYSSVQWNGFNVYVAATAAANTTFSANYTASADFGPWQSTFLIHRSSASFSRRRAVYSRGTASSGSRPVERARPCTSATRRRARRMSVNSGGTASARCSIAGSMMAIRANGST